MTKQQKWDDKNSARRAVDQKRWREKNKRKISDNKKRYYKSRRDNVLLHLKWIRQHGSYSEVGIDLRIFDIALEKVKFYRKKRYTLKSHKEALAMGRKKIWQQLRKDFENIQRMQIAA